MQHHLQTIDPLADERWQSFVAGNADATIFHHVEWLRLIHAQYRYPMHVDCVLGADGEILAGLPFAYVSSRLTGRRQVSLPFSDLCPVLVAPGDHEPAVAALMSSIADQHRRTGVAVELRTPVAGMPAAGKTFYHHELTLHADVEQVRAGFSKNPRRDVKRAEREGVTVRRGVGRADLDAFYELHLQTRRRQGVPTQPKRFIRSFERLLGQGLGFVSLAVVDDEPVAAAVFLAFGRRMLYKYGASDQAHLSRRPNHAIFMDAISWGCEQGLQTLDFGRTDLDNPGLRRFKLGWGAVEHELAYVSLPERAAGSEAGVPGFARKLIMGTPPLTGRLAGVVLYRHFG